MLLQTLFIILRVNNRDYVYKWKRGSKESDGSLSQSFADIPARVLELVHYTDYGDDRPEEQYELYTDRIADQKF